MSLTGSALAIVWILFLLFGGNSAVATPGCSGETPLLSRLIFPVRFDGATSHEWGIPVSTEAEAPLSDANLSLDWSETEAMVSLEYRAELGIPLMLQRFELIAWTLAGHSRSLSDAA